MPGGTVNAGIKKEKRTLPGSDLESFLGPTTGIVTLPCGASGLLSLGSLAVFLGSPLEADLLLLAEVVALLPEDSGAGVMGLPGRGSEELDAAGLGVIEDLVDLLEGLIGGLGEDEEDVDEHGGAEDGEEDVSPPGDLLKRRGHEVGEGKVERPVRGGGEGDGLSTEA